MWGAPNTPHIWNSKFWDFRDFWDFWDFSRFEILTSREAGVKISNLEKSQKSQGLFWDFLEKVDFRDFFFSYGRRVTFSFSEKLTHDLWSSITSITTKFVSSNTKQCVNSICSILTSFTDLHVWLFAMRHSCKRFASWLLLWRHTGQIQNRRANDDRINIWDRNKLIVN